MHCDRLSVWHCEDGWCPRHGCCKPVEAGKTGTRCHLDTLPPEKRSPANSLIFSSGRTMSDFGTENCEMRKLCCSELLSLQQCSLEHQDINAGAFVFVNQTALGSNHSSVVWQSVDVRIKWSIFRRRSSQWVHSTVSRKGWWLLYKPSSPKFSCDPKKALGPGIWGHSLFFSSSTLTLATKPPLLSLISFDPSQKSFDL